ncbi:hypothetical protein A3K55_01395 [Candidatus Shapirobacteria bacterium RBG_13_44_7]|uniref:DUF5615 domain-containing protein n=1 Tax=Candidatus Shapirobacteria bacterium RBG_13_44_7 TaxID=1802149 RepID=A0A1F7SG37_9BACT|nr:MAG: hypothetical protein A3K55_01395 [Candidatus Shapirobacteria bacterium RBG_13_44_7]
MKGKKGHIPKFVLDVHAYYSTFTKKYSKRARFIKVSEITGRDNTEDPDIYVRCNAKNLHLITQNFKDFKKELKSSVFKRTGVVSIETKKISDAVEEFGEVLKAYPNHEDYSKKCIRITKTTFKEVKLS